MVQSETSMRPSIPGVKHLVIVAGGRGTRLRSVARDLPKSLVLVGGKPVLQHQLELAKRSGVDEVTIFAGHLAHSIASFVGDGSRFGLRVRVFVEADYMGNAGALLRSLDSLPEQFFVVYGDVMFAVDLERFAQRHVDRGADFTTFVHPNDHPCDSDLLETDSNDWVIKVHACPHSHDRSFGNLANAGLYVIRRDALWPWSDRPGKQDFVKSIIGGLLAKNARVLSYRSNEYSKDMGTPARLERVEADWHAGKITLDSHNVRPAIFLDRDGTLNVETGHLRKAEDLELIAGVGPALRALRKSGFSLVLLTNQPVIARGEATEADVASIHRRLEWELGKEGAYLDAIYVCPHHPDNGFPGERSDLKTRCECRKPGTGMFEQACRDLRINPAFSWMIGDQKRDIEMARRAGLRSILVRTGAAGSDGDFPAEPDHIADDLPAAASLILQDHETATA
jgi:D,D-heptose 1,7-bisphosphate phosphatase